MPSAQDFTPNNPLVNPSSAVANGPSILINVDYFEPLPVTPRGNAYILLFTDRFSHRLDMYAMTAAQLATSSSMDIHMN